MFLKEPEAPVGFVIIQLRSGIVHQSLVRPCGNAIHLPELTRYEWNLEGRNQFSHNYERDTYSLTL